MLFHNIALINKIASAVIANLCKNCTSCFLDHLVLIEEANISLS